MNLGLWILLGVVVLVILWFVGTYNGLIGSRNTVDEAFSNMDVMLKKRNELIPSLVNIVKGYATHEKDTLREVIEARNAAVNATTPEAAAAADGQLNQVMGRLFALSESYPALKADTQFTNLTQEYTKIQTEVTNARKYYNGSVRQFNTKIQVFPTNLIANMMGFKAYPLFEITDATERENVTVEF